MKALLKHILIVTVLIAGGLYFVMNSMSGYTRHGETIQVPDLRSFSVSEVEEKLNDLELRYVVLDTGAYNPAYPKSSVIKHEPEPGNEVKKDRKIYLTLNPAEATMVKVPQLRDQHLRRAISFIESSGLELGKFIYKDDLARDVVIGMRHKKKKLKFGELLPKGSQIDIVLGNGNGQVEIAPELIGMKMLEATEKIRFGSMNIGDFRFDKTVTDTLAAFVYKQKPGLEDEPVSLGTEIDLWFTADSTKLPVVDEELLQKRDSLKAVMNKLTKR